MKVLRLQTQGFKRIVAVDITPGDPVVRVSGNNAEGKSSLLDSIKAALGGASAAPIKPIRSGDDFAAIRVELGDDQPAIIVEKYFDDVGEKLKVTTADGYKATQSDVDRMLGRMTFDPLAFAKLKPADQAIELRKIVPLRVDLDKLAADDKADTIARRDVNRDAKATIARLDALPAVDELPEERPDLDVLTATLASAADTNSAIERERTRRDTLRGSATAADERAAQYVATAARLRREAEEADKAAVSEDEYAASVRADLDAMPPLDEAIDTTAARQAIDDARAVLARFAVKDQRDQLSAEVERLRGVWNGHDKRIKDRAAERASALADAEMPVPGLSLARRCDVIPGDTSEDLLVVYEGEPFEQASSAQQLRVSMRLAMSANPRLRVMLIKDGSLLDPKGLDLVRELAADGDYQVWLESVGEGDGTGIIMEAGTVRGAETPEPMEAPKRRKPKGEGVVEIEAGAPIKAGQPVKLDDAGKAVPLVEGSDGLARTPASDPPARPARKPAAMREFTTPKPGDLFGQEN